MKSKARPEVLESLDTVEIPTSFRIGGVDVPTDVLQREFTADYRVVPEAAGSDRKKRLDPIVPGISVANVHETAGTIGCLVFDSSDGTPYILSNWHVLQGPEGAIGDDVVQPGPFDDNRVHLNRLGKLIRSHLGHAGDCAVATIEDRAHEPAIIDLKVKAEKLGEPTLGDKVVKSGRTTAITHGIVTRVQTIAKIDYGGSVGEQEIGGFEIGVDPRNKPANGEVSMGGDSGSVWLFKSRTGKPSNVLAGLHFAGEGPGDPNEHAVACYAKSSLFGGPVFHADDREFRGVQIPHEFWKVIAFVEGGKLKAKGFLLTQSLDELEALELDPFKVFQVALTEIESRCGLTFPNPLKSADSVGERIARRAEALASARRSNRWPTLTGRDVGDGKGPGKVSG